MISVYYLFVSEKQHTFLGGSLVRILVSVLTRPPPTSFVCLSTHTHTHTYTHTLNDDKQTHTQQPLPLSLSLSLSHTHTHTLTRLIAPPSLPHFSRHSLVWSAILFFASQKKNLENDFLRKLAVRYDTYKGRVRKHGQKYNNAKLVGEWVDWVASCCWMWTEEHGQYGSYKWLT
jgi:hypothetical protein